MKKLLLTTAFCILTTNVLAAQKARTLLLNEKMELKCIRVYENRLLRDFWKDKDIVIRRCANKEVVCYINETEQMSCKFK